MSKEAVGVGTVASEIGWLLAHKPGDQHSVSEQELLMDFYTNFGLTEDEAKYAITMAERCGLITRKTVQGETRCAISQR